MKLIYGSTAIKHWFPDFKREPSDLDYIQSKYQVCKDKVEYYWTDAFSYLDKNIDKKYVDPDYLYTIKLSHLSWDVNWDKHMWDLIFLKSKWCKNVPEFYDKLVSDWSCRYWSPKIYLKGKNEDFFKPIIWRKYDHDWLHWEYAIYWRPMHEKIRPDLSSPYCDVNLWESLSYQEKLDCAIEEIYVIATERWVFIDKPLPLWIAKAKSLKKMITSSSSWWFNLFVKENFKELLEYKPKIILDKIKELWQTNN